MVATWKVKASDELAEKLKKAKTVGIVKVSKLPSDTFQQMRKGLRGKAEIKVAKVSVIKRAFEKANMKGMEDYAVGQIGIVTADTGAFKLSKIMNATKTQTAAKPGSIAEADIVIPAGDTPFKAGPIIGDLQKVGIKAKIQSGKIVVTDDSPVVKKGQPISADLANVLTRLGIKPIELGLTIQTAYEDGMIYQSDVLNIDTDSVIRDFALGKAQALSIALKAEIYNKESIQYFLRNAFTDSIALAMSKEIVNKDTIEALLAKANMQVAALNAATSGEAQAHEAPKKEEKKEEAKSEEEAASGLASLFG
jgi:large subunit ribosomal protein L10